MRRLVVVFDRRQCLVDPRFQVGVFRFLLFGLEFGDDFVVAFDHRLHVRLVERCAVLLREIVGHFLRFGIRLRWEVEAFRLRPRHQFVVRICMIGLHPLRERFDVGVRRLGCRHSAEACFGEISFGGFHRELLVVIG